MSNEKVLFTWYGKPNTDLSREELLEIIQFQQKEIVSMRSEHSRQMEIFVRNKFFQDVIEIGSK